MITTDEALHEISSIKENVKKDILKEINRRGYDNLIIELFRLKDDVNVLYYEYYAAFKERNENKAERKI